MVVTVPVVVARGERLPTAVPEVVVVPSAVPVLRPSTGE
jgi:hypothetical protein